ncbi:MAG: glycosyltransferase family 2 protein [Bacteroidales bacterium]|nr:glycosyltransferase family 2 protein [Bacteroidales bacterium]
MTPRFSFLLPAYKALFLHEAITSILSQDYPNYELVIVNDASPEDIDSIVQSFSDNRIQYYKNERNLGGINLIAQWQHCVDLSDSEYIIMASDDDVYLPNYLSEMDRLAKRYPLADVFHCHICRMDSIGQITDISAPCKEWESAIESFYYRNIAHRMQTLPEFMFRRTALEEAGGFVDFPLGYYSDDATVVRTGMKHGIVCSDKYLLYSRSSGLNISSNHNTLPQRLQACEDFLHWAERFVDTLTPQNKIEEVLLQHTKELLWFRQQDMAHSIVRQMNNTQLNTLLRQRNSWPFTLISVRNVLVQLLHHQFCCCKSN